MAGNKPPTGPKPNAEKGKQQKESQYMSEKRETETSVRDRLFPQFSGATMLAENAHDREFTEKVLLLPKKQGDLERFKFFRVNYSKKPQVITLKYEGLTMKIRTEAKNGEILISSHDWVAAITPAGIKPKSGRMPEVVKEALAMTVTILEPRDEAVIQKYSKTKIDLKQMYVSAPLGLPATLSV